MTKHSTMHLLILLLCATTVLSAQSNIADNSSFQFASEMPSNAHFDNPEWVNEMYANPKNIAKIKELNRLFYVSNPFVKNQHTQFFKRLLREHSRALINTSGLSKAQLLDAKQSHQKKLKSTSKTGNQWSTVGPFDLDLDAAGTGNTPGTAHIYHIDFCHGLTQHMLAGTATAGLWKSSNAATSWELITQDLMVNEVKAASYEPLNPSVIYFASNNDFYKTIDGGYTWTITGGSPIMDSYFHAYEILVNPDDIQEIYMATNIGLFKSDDKGEQFVKILEGNTQDVEFHPIDRDIVYAVVSVDNKTEFHQSLNSGEDFTNYSEGYPMPTAVEEQKRTQLAVSIDDPDVIYAIAVGKMNGGSGLVGIYKSVNQGVSWQRNCCGDEPGGQASALNPNVMEWECGGENNGGQYYYDLAIAVDPTNTDNLVTGGINLWSSEDSGNTMNCLSDFIYRRNPATYVHADIHSIKYNDGKIWVGSDGGIFCSSDGLQSFEKKMNGIVGTDFRGFDVGFFDKGIMLGGTYHNGTFLREGDTYLNDWISTRSGDNTRAFVNTGDNNLIYDQTGMRELSGDRLLAPHNIPMARKPNSSFTPGESSEIVCDPFHFNKIYLGQNGSLYVSENNGVTYETVKTFGGGLVTAIEKSPTNPALMYVVYYPSYSAAKKIMRTTNGGASWTEVTPPSSMFNDEALWVAMDITIGSRNPYEIWLARVPQSVNGLTLDGMQVFYSSNGGDTWQNYSTPALDGEFPTNIVHQKGSNSLVYLGTRLGVYYRSSDSGDWIMMNNNIPASTYSSKLVPHYKSGSLLNATTRGVYEIDFVEPSSLIAIPTVDKRHSDCLRDTFYFMDSSPVLEDGLTREWSFPGADIPTSTLKNPKVTYSTPGTFPMTLSIEVPGASASYSELNFISVNDGCQLEAVVGNNLKLGNGGYARIPPYKRDFEEITITAWVKRQGVIYNSAGVVLHRDGPQGTGMIIRSDGQLSFLWDEVQNDFESGLIVPYNKWSHVAMAVSSSGIRLYVDGIEAEFSMPFAPVTLLENFFIGGDEFSISNFLGGYIDEVTIFDKAMSAEDIRLSMNVTHSEQHPNILSYFQANNSTGKLTDRVGNSHAYMMNSITREGSNAPISGGCADIHIIDLPGTYDFECADVSLTFDDGDILPMGPVSIAKLSELPVMPQPDGTGLSENYWIINNSGDNQVFSAPSAISFGDYGIVDSIYLEYPEIHKLYKVPAYWEYGWGNPTSSADSIHMTNNTTVMYDASNGVTSSGKIILTEEGFAALAFMNVEIEVSVIQNNHRFIEWEHQESIRSYSIYRSTDGHNWDLFSEIGHKESAVASYAVDKEALSGGIYYKLICEDLDGEQFESNMKFVQVSNLLDLRYYPNMLEVGQSLTIEYNSTKDLSLNIFDLHGRLVQSQHCNDRLEVISMNLAAGQYVLEFEDGHQTIHGQIIIY